jgi:dihydroorotate dehydrogenase
MGGKAVQVYSAYVFEGPQLLKKINSEIIHFLNKHEISDLETFFSLPLEERIRLLDHP